MAHWLFKSEPSAWSYEKLASLGAAGTDWSGVRNHTAKLNMQAMKVGEQAFFYHSNEGKAVVGIVEVCKAYRPDPTDETGKFGMVDIRAVRPLQRRATLEEAKADRRLARRPRVTQSRLPVQPVTDPEWAVVCKRGGRQAAPIGPSRGWANATLGRVPRQQMPITSAWTPASASKRAGVC